MKVSTLVGITAAASIALASSVVSAGRAEEDATDHRIVSREGAPPIAANADSSSPLAADEVTGKVTGKILFDGKERPKVEEFKITEEQAKGCTSSGSAVDPTSRTYVISAAGGIKNCVIEISVKGAELVVPDKPIDLDQAACRYEPHVTLVAAGTTVDFLNSDSISHNVHTSSTRNTPFNKLIPAGSKHTQKMAKPEVVEVNCDVHPWMNSWIYVTDTPFAAISEVDGSFTIDGLPPGKYKLDVWHEKLGKSDVGIEVAPDGSCAPVEVKMSVGGKSGRRKRRK